MEIFTIIGVIAVIVFVIKKLTAPTDSDRLTLLQLENWAPIYLSGSILQKSRMATSLLVQSVQTANNMGATISVEEFMRSKNENKITSTSIIEQWLICIQTEIANDIPISHINSLPARTVGAILVIRMENPAKYRELFLQ